MQSFQEFLQSRKAAAVTSTDTARPQLRRSSTAIDGADDGLRPRPSSSFVLESIGSAIPVVTNAPVHSNTPNGSQQQPGLYQPRLSCGAGSQAQVAEASSATMQQLMGFKDSAMGLPTNSSVPAGMTAVPAMAGWRELGRVSSSRRSDNDFVSRLQPLSLTDALLSPKSCSKATTPWASHPPSGAHMPTGGRRYQVSDESIPATGARARVDAADGGNGLRDSYTDSRTASALGAAGGISGTAGGLSRRVTEASSTSLQHGSALSVLAAAAARAAALKRNTSLTSQASYRQGPGLQAVSSVDAAADQQHLHRHTDHEVMLPSQQQESTQQQQQQENLQQQLQQQESIWQQQQQENLKQQQQQQKQQQRRFSHQEQPQQGGQVALQQQQQQQQRRFFHQEFLGFKHSQHPQHGILGRPQQQQQQQQSMHQQQPSPEQQQPPQQEDTVALQLRPPPPPQQQQQQHRAEQLAIGPEQEPQLAQQQQQQHRAEQLAIGPEQEPQLAQQQQQQQQPPVGAEALLLDLDARFASIKEGLQGVLDAPGSSSNNNNNSQQHLSTTSVAASAAIQPQQRHAVGVRQQHVMVEPYSLDDSLGSDSASMDHDGPLQQLLKHTEQQLLKHTEQQQQQVQADQMEWLLQNAQQQHTHELTHLLSPADSSRSDIGKISAEMDAALWRQQQQQEGAVHVQRHQQQQPGLSQTEGRHQQQQRGLNQTEGRSQQQQQQQQPGLIQTESRQQQQQPGLIQAEGRRKQGPAAGIPGCRQQSNWSPSPAHSAASSQSGSQKQTTQQGSKASAGGAAVAAVPAAAAAVPGSATHEATRSQRSASGLQASMCWGSVTAAPLESQGNSEASLPSWQQHITAQEVLSTHSLSSASEEAASEDAFEPCSISLVTSDVSQPFDTSSLAADSVPQPRRTRPVPSIPQNKPCQAPQQFPDSTRHAATAPAAGASASAGGGPGGTGKAVAVKGKAVRAGASQGQGKESRSSDHTPPLTKQHTQDLQQQNDALVRVLERERQQHAKTQQQVSDLQLDLKETNAEWEVKLQVLRQDVAAAHGQLQRALAGTDYLEMFDAYDAALAASAARVEEAQRAAALLASQLTEAELQYQQLQLAFNDAGEAPGEVTRSNPSLQRADGVAVRRAIASAERRSPEKQRPLHRPTPPLGSAADSDSNSSSRGIHALRQHQAQLEQQLAKQSKELSHLQRENVKLLRFKKQYEVAAHRLQALASSKTAAEHFAVEAGLRAAAASGRADKLEMQLEELQRQHQQLRSEKDMFHLQLEIAQQQQRLQTGASGLRDHHHTAAAAATTAAAALGATPGPPACSAPDAAKGTAGGPPYSAEEQSAPSTPGHYAKAAPPCSAAGGSSGLAAPSRPSAAAAALTAHHLTTQQTATPPHTVTALLGPGCLPAVQPAAAAACGPEVTLAGVIRTTPAGSLTSHLFSGGAGPGCLTQAATSPCATSLPEPTAAEQAALGVVQQLQSSLSSASPVQDQLSSLMSALKAGVQERQALAEQGRVLFNMLVGSS